METDTPKVVEVDCSTGVQTVRELTSEEIAARDAAIAEGQARKIEEDAAAEAKLAAKASAEAKLAAIGLTAEEIAAL